MPSSPIPDPDPVAPIQVGPEAAVVAELGRSQGALVANPIHLDDTAMPVGVVLPRGYQLQIIDQADLAEAPRHLRRTAINLTTTESFVRYVKRYADVGNVLYAEPDDVTVTAVLNDHVGVGSPGWRDHRAVLCLEPTDGWLRWTQAHGRYLSQEEFSELVEDGITEIADPPGADLLELAQSIRATTNARFSSDKRLANGQVQLSYVETIDARAGADGSMTIPGIIRLVVTPFYGAQPVQLDARLRYRLGGGKLVLGVWLVRWTEVLRDAFDVELQAIAEGTGFLPLSGSPS